MSFELHPPSHLSLERPLNYQKFLEASEIQMKQHPEWQARLCTPSWLQKQRIKLVPKELKKKPSPTAEGLDLDSLQTELTRLVDQIHNVQQQMDILNPEKRLQDLSLPEKFLKPPNLFPILKQCRD